MYYGLGKQIKWFLHGISILPNQPWLLYRQFLILFLKMSSYMVYRWFIIQILEFNSMFKESVCNLNHLDINYFPCAFPHTSVLKGRVLGGGGVLFHRSREYKQVYFLFCFVFSMQVNFWQKKKMSWENPGNFNSTGNPRSLSLNISSSFLSP